MAENASLCSIFRPVGCGLWLRNLRRGAVGLFFCKGTPCPMLPLAPIGLFTHNRMHAPAVPQMHVHLALC